MPVLQGSEDLDEEGDVLGNVSSTAWVCCYAWAAGLLRPIQQDFYSPLDLVPVSERALDIFGQVYLIPERPSGAGLQAFPSSIQDCKVLSGGGGLSGRADGFMLEC
jgi:hypothetical protein